MRVPQLDSGREFRQDSADVYSVESCQKCAILASVEIGESVEHLRMSLDVAGSRGVAVPQRGSRTNFGKVLQSFTLLDLSNYARVSNGRIRSKLWNKHAEELGWTGRVTLLVGRESVKQGMDSTVYKDADARVPRRE